MKSVKTQAGGGASIFNMSLLMSSWKSISIPLMGKEEEDHTLQVVFMGQVCYMSYITSVHFLFAETKEHNHI